MKKRLIPLGLLMAGLLTIFSGCGSTTNHQAADNFDKKPAITYNPAHYPVTITEINSEGKEQKFTYKKPPNRIVAVWQSSVETLIALGVGDHIVAGMGIPDAKYLLPQYRETYLKIPTKSLQNFSTESVLAMKPDFILGWYSTFQPKNLKSTQFWLQRNVNTYIAPASTPSKLGHQNLESEYKYISDLGKIFDRQDKASAIVNEMKKEIVAATTEAARQDIKPSALIFEFSGKNLRVYGKDTLAGDILLKLHGNLLAANQRSISKEQVLSLNPDVMFIIVIEDDYANPDKFLNKVYNDPVFAQVKAVKNHKVYIVPLYAAYSAGIRSLDGIRIMAKGLYPNIKLDMGKEFSPDPNVMDQFRDK